MEVRTAYSPLDVKNYDTQRLRREMEVINH